MNRFCVNTAFATGMVFSLWLVSCVSSEGTGSSGSRAVDPQQTVVPIDTPKIRKQMETTASRETKPASRPPRSGTRLLTRTDTLKASVTRKSGTSAREITRPDNPAYTVQIGAFRQAQNALRLQKNAKERLNGELVLNTYEDRDKLYRVSVGKFETRKEASGVRKTLLEKYPKEYSSCWVNYIPK